MDKGARQAGIPAKGKEITMAMNDNREVTYEIVEEIGVLTEHSTGWNKEINMVSWNGNSAKYDIRDWSPDHAQMGRGITLHEKEMRMMLDLLRKRPRTNRSVRLETVTEDSTGESSDDASFMSPSEAGGGDDKEKVTEEAAFCKCTDEESSDEECTAAAV